MKYLSDLGDGQVGVIARVKGKGAFIKRITEMGFVAGTRVKAIKKAPLQDPVEYELIGYRVSLRLAEAAMIELGEDVKEAEHSKPVFEATKKQKLHSTDKTIRVALVGNPNSGKTTLFNRLTGRHERVGNFAGVTVDVKTAHFNHQDYRFEVTDLPGTYSVSEFTPEERFVRRHLTENPPDVVINVVDAGNLERNLFLTTQLIDMEVRVVIALNMYDELEAKGDRFDHELLGKMTGIEFVPTVASKGKGLGNLLDKVVDVYEDPREELLRVKYNPELSETDARYAFIRGALKETYFPTETPRPPKGYGADKILTNKWLGIPLFLFFMWAMFQLTFTLGAYPMEWIEMGVAALGEMVADWVAPGMVKSLLVDGVIGGVGGVIVFLPNILIMFCCISVMEETGYMARAAFIMDKAMHRIGLHGKSFIPMLMGFGCSVPAIMATRTLDNRRDRILTMLAVPFMSCSARLPVYVLLISMFFTRYQGLVLLGVYAIGVALACVSSIVLGRVFFKKSAAPFVMELPPYRIPGVRDIARHTWDKAVQYLTKMGTVILAASIIVWALGYFPLGGEELSEVARLENSYIGRIGHALEPVISPLGFDWKMGVGLLAGVGAKEIVVSTMGVLGAANFTPLVAFTFMLFILIYFPCIATLAAIRKEAGWRWALFAAVYTTALAWIVCFVVSAGTCFVTLNF